MLYEGGIKVPFIVNFPGKIKPNQTKDNLIYFPDVMPTLADLSGAKLPQHLDGISFKPLLKGKKQNTNDRILYWEFPGQQVAVRKGKWKAVSVKKNADLELYDMEKDPFEKNNLSSQHPEIVDELKQEIQKSRVKSPYYE